MYNMYRIIYIPKLKYGQSDIIDNPLLLFDSEEEAEECLREFWLPETNSIRDDYRIEEI